MKRLSEYTEVAESSVKTKFKFLSVFPQFFFSFESHQGLPIVSQSLFTIYTWAIQPSNSSQISALSPLASLKAGSGYQSPGAYVKWNFISMKVKEFFTFHLKHFTMCSNYSTPFFNQILVRLHFITDLLSSILLLQ